MSGPSVRLPVLSLKTLLQSQEFPLENKGFLPECYRYIKIRAFRETADEFYGVRMEGEDLAPDLKAGATAVFARTDKGGRAWGNIYCLGIRGEGGCLARGIQKDVPSSASASETAVISKSSPPAGRRKSFMTPTPLHVPGSRTAPIPPSAHQTVFLKPLGGGGKVKGVLKKNVLWMHPLVCILDEEG